MGQDSRSRFNPQNGRLFFEKAAKKGDVIEGLYKPKKRRAPGIMAHITVSAAGGGKLGAARPYRNMLEANMIEALCLRKTRCATRMMLRC